MHNGISPCFFAFREVKYDRPSLKCLLIQQFSEHLGYNVNDFSLSMHRSRRSKWIDMQMADESHPVRYWFSGLTLNEELSIVSTKLH